MPLKTRLLDEYRIGDAVCVEQAGIITVVYASIITFSKVLEMISLRRVRTKILTRAENERDLNRESTPRAGQTKAQAKSSRPGPRSRA